MGGGRQFWGSGGSRSQGRRKGRQAAFGQRHGSRQASAASWLPCASCPGVPAAPGVAPGVCAACSRGRLQGAVEPGQGIEGRGRADGVAACFQALAAPCSPRLQQLCPARVRASPVAARCTTQGAPSAGRSGAISMACAVRLSGGSASYTWPGRRVDWEACSSRHAGHLHACKPPHQARCASGRHAAFPPPRSQQPVPTLPRQGVRKEALNTL